MTTVYVTVPRKDKIVFEIRRLDRKRLKKIKNPHTIPEKFNHWDIAEILSSENSKFYCSFHRAWFKEDEYDMHTPERCCNMGIKKYEGKWISCMI